MSRTVDRVTLCVNLALFTLTLHLDYFTLHLHFVYFYILCECVSMAEYRGLNPSLTHLTEKSNVVNINKDVFGS